MKTLRIVVISALALMGANAFAQETPVAQQGSEDNGQGTAALAVGGVSSSTSEMGAPMGKTRGQVYQDLLQSQRSGEAARLQELYRGGN